MKSRLAYYKVAPEAMKAMEVMESYTKHCGLEPLLLELIKLRASQLNGCAYCIDMHSKDARTLGETEQRLYGLSAWKECPFYSERERAALGLTEAATLISHKHVPDDVYAEAKTHFSDEELINLMMAIVTINVWNRFAITFQSPVGNYQPNHFITGNK